MCLGSKAGRHGSQDALHDPARAWQGHEADLRSGRGDGLRHAPLTLSSHNLTSTRRKDTGRDSRPCVEEAA
ncbi:hypothetical protein PsYK624_149760 [Phanerochaete sordida]|uniref:Uncharacterized protein n=1 Tax=Phanerochaete sordida TaxID=48140 RepID=A0A9P3LKV5_9APHY|nr:hypothetical protein PsYK624_149760 [Phanerochaete sordida]